MARMSFGVENCRGATSAATGRSYDSDKSGFITVTDPVDIKEFKKAGYAVAGGMPRVKQYWVCECGWEAIFSHCPKCDRNDLSKIVR